MRTWLILLTILVLSSPVHARAQTPIALESLNVLLWPEYDQPSMLVIYDFTLTDDAPIPTSIELRFPGDANITAVAYQSTSGLLLANYQTQAEEENWQVITLFITEPTSYHIEYYQPLERDGERRSFTYQWTGDYPVTKFDVEVQVPGDSRNIKTNPAIPLVQDGSFLSGGATMSGLGQGQPYRLQLEYSRPNETPVTTPQSAQVEPITPVDENTDGRSTLDNLPLFLGGFGVALILMALFYFFRGQSSPGRVSSPRKRPRGDGAQEGSLANYCPECGTRAHEGDRFCRACGSKLRGN